MSPFETASITAAYRALAARIAWRWSSSGSRPRAHRRRRHAQAGPVTGARAAAESVIREVTAAASLASTADDWVRTLVQIDFPHLRRRVHGRRGRSHPCGTLRGQRRRQPSLADCRRPTRKPDRASEQPQAAPGDRPRRNRLGSPAGPWPGCCSRRPTASRTTSTVRALLAQLPWIEFGKSDSRTAAGIGPAEIRGPLGRCGNHRLPAASPSSAR